MMTTLRDASRRGVSIISFNPFRERSLERFQAPQSPIEMVTLTSTPISESLYQVRVGGDVAVLKGLMKAMIEADDAAIAADAPRVVDVDFINGHTKGFDALATDLRAASWTAIERKSGLSRAQICSAAMVYMNAPTAILVFGMGITQHRYGTLAVQQIANLAMLRGNVGRPGAGVCPVRGHSNVQGDRTVGITEKADPRNFSVASKSALGSNRRALTARCCHRLGSHDPWRVESFHRAWWKFRRGGAGLDTNPRRAA